MLVRWESSQERRRSAEGRGIPPAGVLDLADGDARGLAHGPGRAGEGEGPGAEGGHLEERASAHGAWETYYTSARFPAWLARNEKSAAEERLEGLLAAGDWRAARAEVARLAGSGSGVRRPRGSAGGRARALAPSPEPRGAAGLRGRPRLPGGRGGGRPPDAMSAAVEAALPRRGRLGRRGRGASSAGPPGRCRPAWSRRASWCCSSGRARAGRWRWWARPASRRWPCHWLGARAGARRWGSRPRRSPRSSAAVAGAVAALVPQVFPALAGALPGALLAGAPRPRRPEARGAGGRRRPGRRPRGPRGAPGGRGGRLGGGSAGGRRRRGGGAPRNGRRGARSSPTPSAILAAAVILAVAGTAFQFSRAWGRGAEATAAEGSAGPGQGRGAAGLTGGALADRRRGNPAHAVLLQAPEPEPAVPFPHAGDREVGLRGEPLQALHDPPLLVHGHDPGVGGRVGLEPARQPADHLAQERVGGQRVHGATRGQSATQKTFRSGDQVTLSGKPGRFSTKGSEVPRRGPVSQCRCSR